MAIMIPEKPRDFTPESREGIMFDALAKLPDSYYVVHSFQVTKVKADNRVIDAEGDFVVFHPKKGLLCIEAKATYASYANGTWYYGNGDEMRSGGPFRQASGIKFDIINRISELGLDAILKYCKFFHGVWFPIVSARYADGLTLPMEIPRELILTEEALLDPEPYLDQIFSLTEHEKTETNLNEVLTARLVNEVLCPQFEIAPSATFDADTKRILFHKLLKEQAMILNFLEEQKTAIINGAAGTGKTLVAVEKAKRHAFRGEKVLFLCFNRQLRDYLDANYSHDNIDYETVARFACRLGHTPEPDYALLNRILEEMWEQGTFPYQHVIVDEGQDFGSDAIEEAEILSMLKTVIEDTKENGSFYVFYDKLQLIQARKMPQFLEDADCKLTLYRNCRNTENIAKTSLRPVSERTPKLIENCIAGALATLHFRSDADGILAALDDTLDALLQDGIQNIVILTCKKEADSVLKPYLQADGTYPAGKQSIRFTTCRKFKGLEADAVILVDVDENTFLGNNGQNVLLYYVGASRARLRLDIITILTKEESTHVLQALGKTDRVKRPQLDLARALNALPDIEDA